MSDEIYKDMYYEGSHTSITLFDGMVERTIILDGFSKSYAMTGWRLGYGCLPGLHDGPGHKVDDQQRFVHFGRGCRWQASRRCRDLKIPFQR